jgi:hypothetical protein
MFRKTSFVAIAFVAAALVGVGCGGAGESLDANEVDDIADAKADGASALRMGTYDVDLDLYYSLTLEKNGSYKLIGGCRPGPTGPHCFAISEDEGHYRLTKSGSSRYIRLYSDLTGELAYRFQYKVSGTRSEKVSLTETHTGKHYTATLEQANLSQEGESCGGFVGSLNACADGLSCKAAASCCDLPGVCVRN